MNDQPISGTKAFAASVQLQTRQLRIRELVATDRDAIARELANPHYRQYVLPLQNGDAYVDSIVAESLVAARQQPRLIFRLVIECITSAKYLGYGTLHLGQRGTPTAYLGFEIAESASGRGVATEAGGALVDFAFVELAVEHVLADMDERNLPCRRTLEKLGFTRVRLWPWHRIAMRRKYRTRLNYMRVGLTRARWTSPRLSPSD